MNVDHYFVIGKPHVTQGSPCEDYALSGAIGPGVLYGAVSDGCGGAFADTDVGARALVHGFKRVLAGRVNSGNPGEGTGCLGLGWVDAGFRNDLLAQFVAHQFTGRREDYLATLVGVVGNREKAQVFCFGDGAVAVRYGNGQRVLLEAEWWGNAPFYLAYLQEERLVDDFMAQFARGDHDPLLGEGQQPFCLKKSVFEEKEGEYVLVNECREWFDFAQVRDGLVLNFAPGAEGIEAIAVLTDGIGRIGELPHALKAFLSFKNFRGGFVKRRMVKALERMARAGVLPLDDLAMACIWFGEDEP